MTTTNTDDLNIGQVLERALPYFDYIAPMVYPSHYPPNFNGWKNPNHYPYELIKFVVEAGARRAQATTTSVYHFGAERTGTTTPALYTKKHTTKINSARGFRILITAGIMAKRKFGPRYKPPMTPA